MKPNEHSHEQPMQHALEKALQEVEQGLFESMGPETTEQRVVEFRRRLRISK